MRGGEIHNVMHREMVMVTSKELVLAVPDTTASEGERLVFCSYLHIAHIEVLRVAERRAG